VEHDTGGGDRFDVGRWVCGLVHGESGYEEPPVLKASDLAPAGMLKGPRFTVDDTAVQDHHSTHGQVIELTGQVP